MSILTRPVVELVSYILTKLHGGLLLDQIDTNQLKANLIDGVYALKDLRFNPELINKNLGDSVLHISKGTINYLSFKIPGILRIVSENTNVNIHTMTIDMCSAKESGFPVLKEQLLTYLNESDEDIQGITLLTKTIGNLLSSINLNINLLILRIKHKPTDLDFIQITIPDLSLIDINTEENYVKNKLLKLKGIRISLLNKEAEVPDNFDYANICVLENELEFNIKISREMLKIDSSIDRFPFCISYDQLKIMTKIISGLKKSEFFVEETENKIQELIDIMPNDLKETIETQILEIRKKDIRINLDIFSCDVLYSGPPEFRKNFEKNDIKESYFSVYFKKIELKSKDYSKLKINMLEVVDYKLVPYALDSSEIFKSARESFNSDFFRSYSDLKGSIDLNSEHFCKNIVISILPIKKSGLSVAFKENESSFEFGDVKLNLTPVLLEKFRSLSTNSSETEQQSTENHTKIDISILKLAYNYDNPKEACTCNNPVWTISTEIVSLKYCGSSILISEIQSHLTSSNITKNILSCNSLVFIQDSHINTHKKSQDTGFDQHLHYHDEQQGDLMILNQNYTESKLENPEEKTGKVIRIGMINANIDPFLIQKLSVIFPSSQSEPKSETSNNWAYYIEDLCVNLSENLLDDSCMTTGNFSSVEYVGFAEYET